MTEPSEPVVVPTALAGERVDRAVALLADLSRSEAAAACAAGDVLVDGRPAPRSRRLEAGQVLEVRVRAAPPGLPEPDPRVPVAVRHADPDVVVVAKPAGLVVHPGAGHAEGTLVHGLLAAFPDIAGVGEPTRPGIVHRLDRDTSGLLVVARSPRAYDALVEALAAREVERRYDALVWGQLATAWGVVDAPIGRSPRRRDRMAVRGTGREARTGYEVRRAYNSPAASLLSCRPETGRTHQIRVHLAAIGHPIVGDAAYGGARASLPLARPFLHAAELAFAHPVSKERLWFGEPLPPELGAVLDRLAG